MRLLLLLCCVLPLTGCIGAGQARQYRYDLDVRNTTDQPVALELLRGRSASLHRMRVDLAAGGSFMDAYTVYGDAEYLEARVRPLAAVAGAPWYISELSTGRNRMDIIQTDSILSLVPRHPAPAPDLP